MKRLTWQNYDMCQFCGEGACCEHYCDNTFPVCDDKAIYDRLAAYEDTGLEPEEIEKAMDIVKSAVSAFEDFGVDRLAELAQADREGRCVVLPCKKGDTVWRIVHDAAPHITKDRCTDIKYENRDIWVHLIGDRVMGGWNFGKLLFLTREEAQAALRRERE